MIINRVLENFNLKEIKKIFIIVGFKKHLLKKKLIKIYK